ncbi:MAG TPA: nickel-dependent hydrogenase large subunit [Spirochaetota bacterium]|nr:nickel-dependent hydrogenase large subunit [Spirochaetota bacterium]
MSGRTIIPFGPQHPVLPEPLHFDFVTEDERIVEAIPSIGYVHRGLELLVDKKDYIEFVYVAERICGICSFMHGMTYCLAIEEIMKLDVPPRAQYLRVIWSELSRMHSHLMWLGFAADAFGFESLFMHSWRMREHVLDIIEATTGGRVIFGSCKVGGTRRDIENSVLRGIVDKLEQMKDELKSVTDVFLKDYSIEHRLRGTGVITREGAHKLGAVGPMLRASGIESDTRRTGYAAYNHLEFAPVVEQDGDCYARCAVRVREIFQSIELIRQASLKIPDGAVEMKVAGVPDGEYFMRVEQPRGEVVYYIKANGTKNIERFRVRTPTFANIPAMVTTMKGSHMADIPNIILTIDPCISCTER